MSKTSLVEAIKRFDLEQVRKDLRKNPELKAFRTDRGFDLLQFCVSRPTWADRAADGRQLRLAKWLVSEGFDPKVIYMTKPGADGEAEPTPLSLVFIAIARAQNNALARYFIDQGAKPMGLFAAAWWGNWEILEESRQARREREHVRRRHTAPYGGGRVAARHRGQARARETVREDRRGFFQARANPDLLGKDGRTVRDIASRKRDKRYINAIDG